MFIIFVLTCHLTSYQIMHIKAKYNDFLVLGKSYQH